MHGGWKFSAVAEAYVERSLTNKINAVTKILHELDPGCFSSKTRSEESRPNPEAGISNLKLNNDVNISFPLHQYY